MNYFPSYADSRLICSCVFCGARTETRDHCPSRILLDEPYPTNLPVVPACATCNTGFSFDEQYFACLVECARTGSVESVERIKIRRILAEKPSLRKKLQQAHSSNSDGESILAVEASRVRSVVLKLARGHAAFEVSETVRHQPSHLMILPLHLLAASARQHFEVPPSTSVWPELGSRAMQRMFLEDGSFCGPQWIDVQANRYRYLVVAEGAVLVRFVVSNYLACEVMWSDECVPLEEGFFDNESQKQE